MLNESQFVSQEVISQNRTTFAVRSVALLFIGTIVSGLVGLLAFVFFFIGDNGHPEAMPRDIFFAVVVFLVTSLGFAIAAIFNLAKSRVPRQFILPEIPK